jgi:LEA14-like dessication related protein
MIKIKTNYVVNGLIPIVGLLFLFFLGSCEKPKEDIVLRNIRDVVVDATSEPMLKANAIFYNPNNIKGKLKNIDVEIFVNGKKAANVHQHFNTSIPARSEFTIPLQVNLAMKELGTMETLWGMLGGKKFEVRYHGSVKLSYKGVPIKVPIDYKDNVRVRF